jgi:hypothetical protein
MKYALKLLMNSDYSYVTRPSGKMYEVEVVTYDSYEEAEAAAALWGRGVRIVEYGK